MTSDEIVEALLLIAPGAEWRMVNNDYSSIEWYSETKKPTLKQIEAAVIKVKENKESEESRKQEILNRLGVTLEELRLLGL